MDLEDAVEDPDLREKIKGQLEDKAGMKWSDLNEEQQKKLAAGSKVLDRKIRKRLGR